jgi:hypothetical protein
VKPHSLILVSIVLVVSFAYAQQKPVGTFDLTQLISASSSEAKAHTAENIGFLNDTELAAGICRFENSSTSPKTNAPVATGCALARFRWDNGSLQVNAQTKEYSPSETIHITDDGRVIALPRGGAPAVLYSADLSRSVELPPLHAISASGRILGEPNAIGSALFAFGNPPRVLREVHGNLLTFNDDFVIVADKGRLRTETLDGKPVGSFKVRNSCLIDAQLTGKDQLYVSDCKGARIVDFNGALQRQITLPPGWGKARWSADGSRVLFDFESRKISSARKFAEDVTVLATLGMGVGEEYTNHGEIKVLDLTTGNTCFDLKRAFPEDSTLSHQDAVISPSGRYLAIVIMNEVSLYQLPKHCGAKQ